MTTPPGQVLSYEPPHASHADPYWWAFRWMILAWSILVLCRHAIYWLGGLLLDVPELARTTMIIPGMVFAAAECILLALLLFKAVRLRRDQPSQHALLAVLCAAYIVVSLLSFALDNRGYLVQALDRPLYALPLLWRLISRVQSLIVPAVAVVVATRWRRD